MVSPHGHHSTSFLVQEKQVQHGKVVILDSYVRDDIATLRNYAEKKRSSRTLAPARAAMVRHGVGESEGRTG